MTISFCFLLALVVFGVKSEQMIENREIQRPFTSISNDGPFIVSVTFGKDWKDQKVRIEADASVVPLIETTVQSSNLGISFKDGVSVSVSSPIRVFVTAKVLANIVNSASGTFSVEPSLTGNDLQVIISGSGGVFLPVLVNNINAVLSGSGDLNINGKAKNVNIAISGSGSFFGQKLRAQQVNVAIYSSGDVQIYCENDLTVWIAGSGNVQYGGNPQVSQQITGSGTVSRNEFEIDTQP